MGYIGSYLKSDCPWIVSKGHLQSTLDQQGTLFERGFLAWILNHPMLLFYIKRLSWQVYEGGIPSRHNDVVSTLKRRWKIANWRWNNVQKGFKWNLFQRHNFNVISTQLQRDFNLISTSFQAWRRYDVVMMSFFLVKTTSEIRLQRFQPHIHVETASHARNCLLCTLMSTSA